ncbi:bifunctional diaminohydroxyphosphoribosylaminopyrimidine deaminase/5-amino-6-(5-phosphoribosylamino)uracil reductase RibD [Lichenihabitans sp. Uapishka_5]|uniref:bifunctional diaminohydroxyphosphoribosylaminopyrimidine deaminase/5-amino-6-(5-phosphoribosylamino)uracil reductase RibD n=1 Tax=Lichenihabitans sp. Uapishka_5 TaxID=3037302 RepID=UPI0029E7CE32|nr:bifunctional diaminohydroxyphosphoribosylaminopyrimidine deaminase/5-amino-6-(5-phosphoribosylamino)uracil reductase RibD [Lichenihabitans sp. Uapishka_5]MDX7950916.1 bifunctional diaminohydroxyphosphoribosylaminopyrimidine deaminase/5-amino-6-(5-phosphoribosylamino)uracil reductase RibD [Lichenihabitans sp. Uapishka_5]
MVGEERANHARWMRAALAFGRRGMGQTAPNPAVAALVVRDGVVLGRGVTAPGGRPHAEPLALAEAGAAGRGATLYVTLEPCSHHGRTPPCTEAIVAAGISRVVYGLDDPDGRVAGRGLAQLREAGIAVVGPVLEAEVRRDHRGHLLRVTEGRPTVSVKMAETADGFAARASGAERLLITGPHANREVHRLRASHDAVMVGIGTVLADDPLLTVRLPGVVARPVRVVLDSYGRMPAAAQLMRTPSEGPLIVLTSEEAASEAPRMRGASNPEITLIGVPTGPDGLDLDAALRRLGGFGLTRVFCEGGPHLASALILGGFADCVVVLTGAQALGSPGLPALSDEARHTLADPAHYARMGDRRLGADRLQEFERI